MQGLCLFVFVLVIWFEVFVCSKCSFNGNLLVWLHGGGVIFVGTLGLIEESS